MSILPSPCLSFLFFCSIIYLTSIQAFHQHFSTLHKQYKSAFTKSLYFHNAKIPLKYYKNDKRYKCTSNLNLSTKKDTNEDGSTGMNEAFNALDQISNIDINDLNDDDTEYNLRDKLNQAIKESDDISTIKFTDEAAETLKEKTKEMHIDDEISNDMKNELNDSEGVYLDILEEISSNGKSKKKNDNLDIEQMINDISLSDDLDVLELQEDDNAAVEDDIAEDSSDEIIDFKEGDLKDSFSRDFMDKALLEVLTDTKIGGENLLGDKSIFDEEELKRQIDKVFEEANVKLKSAVEEVRMEQRESAEKSAKERLERTEEEQQRLLQAEGSVTRLLSKVNKESKQMEEAMKELKLAQARLDQDPLLKVANFKNAGIVKQSLLALSILFSFRSISELIVVATGSVNGDVTSVLVQFGLALVFAFAFFFL